MIKREILVTVVVTVVTMLMLIAMLPDEDLEMEYKSTSLKTVRGLHDCQLFAIESNATKLYVIRCPNSEVSVRWSERRKQFVTLTTSENS